MANVAHKTNDPVEVHLSVNTPEFDPGTWIINPPSLQALLNGAVPRAYWKITPGQDDVVEMDAGEKAAVDAAALPDQKTAKIKGFAAETQTFVVVEGYDCQSFGVHSRRSGLDQCGPGDLRSR